MAELSSYDINITCRPYSEESVWDKLNKVPHMPFDNAFKILSYEIDDVKNKLNGNWPIQQKETTMKLQAYEVMVLMHPKDATKEDTTILVEPEMVLAKDAETAKMHAVRLIDDKAMKDADRFEVLVRNFR